MLRIHESFAWIFLFGGGSCILRCVIVLQNRRGAASPAAALAPEPDFEDLGHDVALPPDNISLNINVVPVVVVALPPDRVVLLFDVALPDCFALSMDATLLPHDLSLKGSP